MNPIEEAVKEFHEKFTKKQFNLDMTVNSTPSGGVSAHVVDPQKVENFLRTKLLESEARGASKMKE